MSYSELPEFFIFITIMSSFAAKKNQQMINF